MDLTRRRLAPVTVCASLIAVVLASSTVRGQERGVTAEQVTASIDRAARYLISQQKANGSWPERRLYAGGLTPLCTLALLHAGYAPESEPVREALDYLRDFTPTATYAASLQTMAFCRGDPRRDLALIARNVAWLEKRQLVAGDNAGMWALPVESTPDHTDNSMSHMAMLALYDAERAGVRASDRTWQRGLEAWRRSQNGDGSWGWGPGYPGSGSMTCGGIASLIAGQAHFAARDAKLEGDAILCCQPQEPDAAIARGQAWLERNFTVRRNPGTEFWHSYYLFALERVGRVTGQRLIAGHDWYREAAGELVAMQLPTGAWPSDMDEEHLADPLVATSFSLLFMAKARRPVVVSHLAHGPAEDWNRHRGAVRNLAAHVERRWRLELAHQTVDISAASVEDLLTAPVMFLSGRDAPQLTAESKRKLRMYIDRGGFLFAVQSCGGGEFDAAFRWLIEELFPEPEAKLRPLELSHPAWYADERVDLDHVRELWGVDVNCRTAVIYCPQDLACHWELSGGLPTNAAAGVAEKVDAALAMGSNVLAYATNREVEFKDPLAPLVAELAAANAPMERGKIYIANVLHGGGCAGAPGALWTVLRLADEQLRLAVDAAPRELSLTDPNLFRYRALFMHGRTAFELTPLERERLGEYLSQGGVLLADAICSSPEFTAAFRKELALVLPDSPLEPISAQDPLLTPEFHGYDLQRVSRRAPVRTTTIGATADAGALVVGPPQLEGVRIDDEWVVVFSPHDLSCALESREPVDCGGYTRADAARITVNVLAYFFH